ncbi:hypothetical protein HDK90DRAFT_497491 [Phyllosticta capitalensis]|uniref:Secreted protein n=1 Tax=Phyllosticta capitalensis TaxID=121624 RepID=A0ABR1YAW6_9PEZI
MTCLLACFQCVHAVPLRECGAEKGRHGEEGEWSGVGQQTGTRRKNITKETKYSGASSTARPWMDRHHLSTS